MLKILLAYLDLPCSNLLENLNSGMIFSLITKKAVLGDHTYNFTWFSHTVYGNLFSDNTGSADQLLPDSGGPGVGVPASSQRPGLNSALRRSSWHRLRGWELRCALWLLSRHIAGQLDNVLCAVQLAKTRVHSVASAFVADIILHWLSCPHRWWEAVSSVCLRQRRASHSTACKTNPPYIPGQAAGAENMQVQSSAWIFNSVSHS